MDKRSPVVTFHVTDEEKEKIRKYARELGFDMANFCRSLVIQKMNQEEAQS